jgi:hypothetical protein
MTTNPLITAAIAENQGRDAARLKRADCCAEIIFCALVIAIVVLAVSHCTPAPAATFSVPVVKVVT